MKQNKVYTLAFLMLAFLFAGCSTLQSPVGKAVFNIGLRSVAYEAAKKNPDSVSKMVELASFIGGLNSFLSPGALDIVIDKHISESSLDNFQKANVRDLASIITSQYEQLHEKHGSQLTESEIIQIVQNMGDALNFGLVPSIDGPAEFVLESDSLIVVVD